MMRTRLYGLNVDTELTFYENRSPVGKTDVTIRLGEECEATLEDEPPGRRMLHLALDGQRLTATQTDDGYVLRFTGTCDFEIDRDLRHVTTRVVDGADMDRVSVLAAGTMLSFLLTMRGEAVLHASAVQLGDAALAFVGRSGMGKSTMATLMCADGAALVTDDVLRLDLSGSQPWCYLGATELRLRKAASELADRFENRPASRLTGDERDALRMREATRDGLRLGAIVIPVPDHLSHDREPEIVQLSPKQALLYLLQFPRIVGWEDGAVLARHLEETSRVVESVPVFVARMPWGPPFAEGLAERVRQQTGFAQVSLTDSTASR